jgi:hypothetical protein
MKTRVCRYSLAPEAFLTEERKSVDILFPSSGRLHRITIPSKFGANFTDILVELDRKDHVPMSFISDAVGLSFREDPVPEMYDDGTVVCFQCGALACPNDEHDHVQNFNILRGLPSLVYERGYILRLTATAMRDSLFMVMITGIESSVVIERDL